MTSISRYAFFQCSSLTSVSFESGSQLTSIGSYAFYNSGLTTITIPASVTSIGTQAFYDCNGFSVYIENGITMSITTGSGQSFYGGSNVNVVIVSCSGGIVIGSGSATIPSVVTSIADSAFSGCYSLTSVSFESGSQLESIGQYAFSN